MEPVGVDDLQRRQLMGMDLQAERVLGAAIVAVVLITFGSSGGEGEGEAKGAGGGLASVLVVLRVRVA